MNGEHGLGGAQQVIGTVQQDAECNKRQTTCPGSTQLTKQPGSRQAVGWLEKPKAKAGLSNMKVRIAENRSVTQHGWSDPFQGKLDNSSMYHVPTRACIGCSLTNPEN